MIYGRSLFLQEQIQQIPAGTTLSPTFGTPSARYIDSATFKAKTPTAFPFFRVGTWLSSVNSEAFDSIKDRYESGTICGQETAASFYIPEPVVRVMLPN